MLPFPPLNASPIFPPTARKKSLEFLAILVTSTDRWIASPGKGNVQLKHLLDYEKDTGIQTLFWAFRYGQLIKYQDPVRSNHLRSTGHSHTCCSADKCGELGTFIYLFGSDWIETRWVISFLNEFYKCQKVRGFRGVPFHIHLVPRLK